MQQYPTNESSDSVFLVRVMTFPDADAQVSATRAIQYIAGDTPEYRLEVLTPALELPSGFFPEAWRPFIFKWSDDEAAFVDNANGVAGGVLKYRNVKGELLDITKQGDPV